MTIAREHTLERYVHFDWRNLVLAVSGERDRPRGIRRIDAVSRDCCFVDYRRRLRWQRDRRNCDCAEKNQCNIDFHP
jgi:hypothetical protein